MMVGKKLPAVRENLAPQPERVRHRSWSEQSHPERVLLASDIHPQTECRPHDFWELVRGARIKRFLSVVPELSVSGWKRLVIEFFLSRMLL